MSVKNVAASVRQRLLNRARQTGEDFQLLFTRYAIERLLFRLAASEHRDAFVLKGAMLFSLWTGEMHRPTRDLDLLGFGDAGEGRLRAVFEALCRIPVTDDGLAFVADSVVIEPIREDQAYGGQRVNVAVTLGQPRIVLQVDIGFGERYLPAVPAVSLA